LRFSSEDIIRTIPHRYPFLLVDKIIELQEGSKAVGIKNVTINEPFFQGHFPGHPIMPAVLILEALAQVGAVALLSKPEFKGKLVYFAAVDKCRFHKPVVPGDTLRLEVTLQRMRGAIGKAAVSATVDGADVASGEITFAVVDTPQPQTQAS